MRDDKSNQYLPYLFIIGVVGIVAIVGLFLLKGSIDSALVYKIAVEEYQYPCQDDDPANNYDQVGIVTHGRVQYVDHCVDNILYQYTCATSNTVRLTNGYECPNGCLEGACLVAPAEASE